MKKEQILILILGILIIILGYIVFLRESKESISSNNTNLELDKEIVKEEQIESKEKVKQCNPNWICDDWSMGKYGFCSEEGDRTRECRDLNNCNTEDLKPDTVMQCEAVRYNPPQLGPFEIEIIGDQYCKDKVNEALDFMKDNSPKFYTKVITYVGVIECADRENDSVVNLFEDPARVELINLNQIDTLTELSGVLVHEAHHSELHIQYRIQNKSNEVPAEIYSGRQAEEKCVNETIKFLKEVNAPADEIYFQENIFEIVGEWWNNPE